MRDHTQQKKQRGMHGIFDFGMALGTQMTIISSVADLMARRGYLTQSVEPFIISASVTKTAMDTLFKAEGFEAYTNQFGKTMEGEQRKGPAGCQRGQRPLPPALATEVQHCFQIILTEDGTIVPFQSPEFEKLAASCAPAVFGILPDVSFCGAEKHHVGCWRIAWRGSRMVICAAEGDIFKMMSQRTPGVSPTVGQLWDFWLQIDKEALEEFIAAGFKAGA